MMEVACQTATVGGRLLGTSPDGPTRRPTLGEVLTESLVVDVFEIL